MQQCQMITYNFAFCKGMRCYSGYEKAMAKFKSHEERHKHHPKPGP